MLKPSWLRPLAIPVLIILVLAALAANQRVPAVSGGHRRNILVIQADTRKPYVPDDPLEPLPFYTFSALLNHDYAIKQGVDYVYLLHDAEEEPMGVHDENRPMCKHPSEGWRAASWCKLPAVWHMIQKFPGHQYFVYIDSDAVYRNPSLPLSRHLDHLTPFRPIGFLSNKPHNGDVCAGYFFLRREAASFLTDWWNVKAPSVNMQRLWEQDALQQLLKNGRAADEVTLATPSYHDRIAFLTNELQFEERDPLQLVYHIPNGVPHRYESYLSQWRLDTPLDDRKALKQLLSRINFVTLNTSAVALEMAKA